MFSTPLPYVHAHRPIKPPREARLVILHGTIQDGGMVPPYALGYIGRPVVQAGGLVPRRHEQEVGAAGGEGQGGDAVLRWVFQGSFTARLHALQVCVVLCSCSCSSVWPGAWLLEGVGGEAGR